MWTTQPDLAGCLLPTGLPHPVATPPSQALSYKKTIFSIKVFVTLLDYLKIPQVAISGDLHV
jgi:hypothetical protein